MRMSRRLALYAINNDKFPAFTYTGLYELDETGEYPRLLLKGAGVLTFDKTVDIDVFLVGGGGGTRVLDGEGREGGGGGGYTITDMKITAIGSTAYSVFIGAGGRQGDGSPTYIDGLSSTANGGKKNPSFSTGGDGGSGGGGASASNGVRAGSGGSDGNDGEDGDGTGGKGQGTTTREFGEKDNPHIYAGGGAGGAGTVGDGKGGEGGGGDTHVPGTPNTGGGGGCHKGGGSGIIVIRKARKAA